MNTDFDIIVIGSGAGGGTLAASCASAGKRVLLLERGILVAPMALNNESNCGTASELDTLIHKHPYDDRSVLLNSIPSRLYMGGVAGGSTALYGAALLRPHPEDFSPGRYYCHRIPTEIHEWPVTYEALLPHFIAAEALYRVAGDRIPQSFGNAVTREIEERPDWCGDSPGFNQSLIPLAPANKSLLQTARQSSLHPYRLPLAIDASTCLKCDSCAGFLCPTGARRSSLQIVNESIQRGDPLTLKHLCEAVSLNRASDGKIESISVRDRETGTASKYTAKRYVLAAGAIGSASLLLKSGIDHPVIGRNYMMHYSPICVGLYKQPTGAAQTFIKQIGCSDFYFGTRNLHEKMGIVQSLPAPGPLMMAKSGLRWVPHWILNLLRSRMLPLVGIIEDLPDPHNRVSITRDGGICLTHNFSDFDRQRGIELSRSMKDLLKSNGAVHCVSGMMPSKEHVAHQCGTIRFGKSRKYAAADPDCRLFDHTNLFVTDGSIMPTSLGVGPCLTIIANSLRVAGIVTSEV